jgi:hypothetical protein
MRERDREKRIGRALGAFLEQNKINPSKITHFHAFGPNKFGFASYLAEFRHIRPKISVLKIINLGLIVVQA